MARRWFAGILMLLLWTGFGETALAQFDQPAQTAVRERIAGVVRGGSEQIVVEAGDEIGAVFGEQVVGRFAFTSENVGTGEQPEFSIVINGDNPDTQEQEGPRVGARVVFQFYDSSANRVRNMAVLTPSGETFNYTFQGSLVPPLPIELPGFDLTPSRNFDLRIGGAADEDGDGDGGDGEPAGTYDVNGDGRVDVEDAAVVLRLVTSGTRNVEAGAGERADVNDDGVVNTQDAVEVLRNR